MNQIELTVQAARTSARNAEGLASLERELQHCSDSSKLMSMLEHDYGDIDGLIYKRLLQLNVADPADLFLAYSLWLYFNGFDNEAFDMWERAHRLAPLDWRVMVIDIWMSFQESSNNIYDKCRNLLLIYPGDSFAESLLAQHTTADGIRHMELPELGLKY